METYVLSIDQGTTSSRAIVFDRYGQARGESRVAHRQIYPCPGWVSQDAGQIYSNVVSCVKGALEAADGDISQVAAIGVTNQRETVVAWDRQTGEPACHAIVWQCRRTEELCEQIIGDGMSGTIRAKTGLLVDPYFSATKIKWMLNNEDVVKRLLRKNRLLVGTMDSFLLWKLSGGKRHVTDYSNASRTMLFNINTCDWDDELLDYFSIPREILPEVVPTSGVTCETEVFGESVPISGIVGDQQASLFGHGCLARGSGKITYGTGCFILVDTGHEPVFTEGGMLATVAWHMGGETTYAIEGSIFDCGAAVDWLINDMGLARDVGELNDICDNTTDTNGVSVVTAFSGLGAPYWDMAARGHIGGLSLSSNKNHIVRAAMESIAFQVKDALDYLCAGAGFPIARLGVDGGVSRSRFLMQFQADILGIRLERPDNPEVTALGAAYMAGLAVSFWKDQGEIEAINPASHIFSPRMCAEERNGRLAAWRKALEKTRR